MAISREKLERLYTCLARAFPGSVPRSWLPKELKCRSQDIPNLLQIATYLFPLWEDVESWDQTETYLGLLHVEPIPVIREKIKQSFEASKRKRGFEHEEKEDTVHKYL